MGTILTIAAALLVVGFCVRVIAPRVHARIDPLGAELTAHATDLSRARARRSSQMRLHAAPLDPDGTASGFTTLVVDTWLRKDFTLRARAVGLSWLPFVAPPEHHETPEYSEMRLRRRYRLDSEEKEALSTIDADDAGRIALIAAAAADRVIDDPAWKNDFFDRYGLRVDLAAEVTHAATTAREVHRGWETLGATPTGQRARDAEIVRTYIDRSRALADRTDALAERVAALEDFRVGVADVRDRLDRRAWLDAATAIDDFDHTVDAVVDRHAADALRASADESSLLASVHLDTLAQSLTLIRLPSSPDAPPR